MAIDGVSTERDLSAVDAIRQDLEGEFEIRRVGVGPQVSRELIQTGLLAVVAAISSMLIYIWFVSVAVRVGAVWRWCMM